MTPHPKSHPAHPYCTQESEEVQQDLALLEKLGYFLDLDLWRNR